MRDQGEAEIRRIAERLADLIPLERELESPLIDRYTMSSFSRTGHNEYSGDIHEHSPSLEKFLELAKNSMEGKDPFGPRKEKLSLQDEKPYGVSSAKGVLEKSNNSNSDRVREEAEVTQFPSPERHNNEITMDKDGNEPTTKPNHNSSESEEQNEDSLSYGVFEAGHGDRSQSEQPTGQPPHNENEAATSPTMQPECDDAFIKAWEKQRFRVPGSSNDDNDDDTVLC